MTPKTLLFSSPFWLTGVYWFHDRFYPYYWDWIIWGVGSLFALWIIGKIYVARRNRRLRRELQEREWGRTTKRQPVPVQQAPVVFQMPSYATSPQYQQNFPTWVDLPEERYET